MVYLISIDYKLLLSVDQAFFVKAILVKHLVIDQRQRAPNFSAFHGFHWSAFRNHQGRTFNEKGPKQAYLPNRTEAGIITEVDQAVRVVHNCNSWLLSLCHGTVALSHSCGFYFGWQLIVTAEDC